MPAEPQIITQKREMPLKQSKGSQFVSLFLQNKPNLPNTQITVTSYLIGDYEDFRPSGNSQNKPKQTQFKPNSKPIKPQKTPFQTKTNPIKPKKTPFQTKTNPIKPNIKPDQTPKNLPFLRLSYYLTFIHFANIIYILLLK